MRSGMARMLSIAAAGAWLAACSTSHNLFSQSDKTAPSAETAPAAGYPAAPETTSAVPPPLGVPAADEPGLLGSDPNDDLSLGKKQYRARNYGLAEQHFRRAVELHPNDAEAWLGLAASCDGLRRFDLADRAYMQAVRIAGPTVEILNNEGYSYMLRGDFKRARATLLEAQRRDPGNKYVENNLKLLDASTRQGKAIE
jgi:tetratricopeptide (TPR) repeat protein